MKKLTFVFLINTVAFFSINAKAQTRHTNDSMNINDENIFVQKKGFRLIESDGRTYGASELVHMPANTINQIANTVPGVNSINGKTPSINGAPPSGTAYYVDGVRVYSGIPPIRK